MAKKETSDELTFEQMLTSLTSALAPVAPNHLLYQPHNKQVDFHKSQAKGRQFIGGNRSGKTVAGANEAIYWINHDHPYFNIPQGPIYGRIVTVDIKNGAEKIIIPKLKQWIPKSLLINGSWDESYNKNLNILTLEDGSLIEIMGHEQDLEKFAGTALHWVWFDEEPPHHIFKECLARLVDYNGRWWMTMTPVDGITWTYDEIYEKADGKLIDVITVDHDENPHLSDEGRQSLQDGMDEDEKAIRKEGKYIAISGLIFKSFDTEKHIVPAFIPDPKLWIHYRSLDSGYSNPTAVLWHAVNRTTGQVITWREHYKSEWTVDRHADFLLEDEKQLRALGVVPYISVADPAIAQRQLATGLSVQIMYSQRGLNFALCQVRDVKAGLDKMRDYLNKEMWQITEDCPNLIKEMRKYKIQDYSTQKLKDKNNKREEAQKKDDHAIDSTRYFFSFMPDLNPADLHKPANLIGNPLGAVATPLGPGMYDENFRRPVEKYPVIGDEFIGEW